MKTLELSWDPRVVTRGLRLGLILAGLASLVCGVLFGGEKLVALAAAHLAPDGQIGPGTARTVAQAGRWLLIGGGALVAAGIAVGAIVRAYHGLESLGIWAARLIFQIAAGLGRGVSRLGRGFTAPSAGKLWEPFLLAVLLALVLILALWAQRVQPPWHSDGLNMQPPKNLVLHGVYDTRAREGLDSNTYKVSTGPGMLLPTALAFKLFGISLQTAHYVALAFFLAFLLFFHRTMRRLYGVAPSLLGLCFFVLYPVNIFFGATNGYISGGMGESPALLYLTIGAVLWSAGLTRKSNAQLLLAGIFWGLSFQTKWLFLIAFLAVVATWGILALMGRRLPSRVYLLPAAGMALVTLSFFLMRVIQVGLPAELAHLDHLWRKHGRRATGFAPEEGQVESVFAVARPLITLMQVDFWAALGAFLAIPAAVYAVVDFKRRPEPLPLFFMVFTGGWFTWWLLFNYDLPVPHLLYIMPFIQLYIAKLLVDGWRTARATRAATNPGHPAAAGDAGASLVSPLRTCLLMAMALVVFGKTVVPLGSHIDDIYQGSKTMAPAYREMVDYINRNTEPDAMFSGWTWSTPWWLAIDNERTVKDRSKYPFEQRESVPEYFVMSPEWSLDKLGTGWPDGTSPSSWYRQQNAERGRFLEENCTHLLTTGTKYQWSIYRVRPAGSTN